MWQPPKPIKFTTTSINKKTKSTLKNLGHGRMEQLADSVRERGLHNQHLEAHAAIMNAQRLSEKQEFQQDLAKKVMKAEVGVSRQGSGLSRTTNSLQQLGAGRPYGRS